MESKTLFLACLLVAVLASQPTWASDVGQRIFRERCADCHGAMGQGGDGYERPLFGEETILDLTRVISSTMPEDDPDAVIGEDASRVAAYIHQAFYSQAARERLGLVKPPRFEISRLTVPQYRNMVADLIGHFTPAVTGDTEAERGLRAEYFESKGMSKANDLKFERVDTRVEFDFGELGPRDDIAADQFAIIWQGSLRTDETGFHEFRIRTPNGVRLYVNNDEPEARRRLRDDSSVAGQAALIDAWVSSGGEREHSARLFLLGGRRYPLRLEFFKYKEATASIQFEWKPPHGVWATVDQRHLRTSKVPRTFVVDTAFPADDRSLGYERGSAVSLEWHEATSRAAVSVAEEVVARLDLLVGNREPEAMRGFVDGFAEIAFRRPLRDNERQRIARLFEQAENPETGLRRSVMWTLSSPHFLYAELPFEETEATDHAVAARLALALWDSLPDQELTDQARRGVLRSEQVLRQQAVRMMKNPRAKAKLREFFHHWLELDERDLAKDKQRFPAFDDAVIADLRYSLMRFIDSVVWSDASDYRELLTADYLLLNQRLGDLYVGPSADFHDTEFVPMLLSTEQRAGVLTHPYLLSALAYHNSTSPIHRGVFITRNIVGRSLKPPPIAVAFKDEGFEPNLSMREKITEMTRDRACMSCHSVVNPLGFALESYDAVGRWRESENGTPVNTRAEYVSAEGDTLVVSSASDIARHAVESQSAHQAFVLQVFRHLIKQNPAAFDDISIASLRDEFAADGFHIQNLVVRIAVAVASEKANSN